MKLLSIEADAKTRKGTSRGYLTGVLYLAPASEAGGRNLCPRASAECMRACLYGAGHAAIFPNIKARRITKTKWYLSDPVGFKTQLTREIRSLVKQAEKRGLIPAVRINGTSDQPALARAMAEMFPNVQFYDYTKIPRPWTRVRENYHLTFSFSGENLGECRDALANNVNIAVVFHGELPATWEGFPVVNGDESDLRFLDPQRVVIGLKAKGLARKIPAGGFVQIGV